MEIRRDFYLDKLIRRKNNGLIKVITGIRRCGKSYLLNNIFYNHLLESGVPADHIIRFAFDSADDLYLIGESLIIRTGYRNLHPPHRIGSACRTGTCLSRHGNQTN